MACLEACAELLAQWPRACLPAAPAHLLPTPKLKPSYTCDEIKNTSNLNKAHETRDSLSSSCSHTVLVYLQPFRRNSPLKCALQPKIAKKIAKPHFWKFKVVHGRSRLSVLIKLDSVWLVLVMISNMSVPIHNCFHTTSGRANIAKTLF